MRGEDTKSYRAISVPKLRAALTNRRGRKLSNNMPILVGWRCMRLKLETTPPSKNIKCMHNTALLVPVPPEDDADP